MLELILPPTRFSSPVTAGLYTDIPLKVTEGVALDDVVQYFVLISDVKSANTALAFRLDHSPDGRTVNTHTSSLFAGVASPGFLARGQAGSAMLMDFAHPVLRVGSVGTGDQWAVVQVWQHRKRYANLRPEDGRTVPLGLFRLDSSPTSSAPGIALPVNDQGSKRRVVQYWLEVKEASAGAQVGVQIQTGPDGENWSTNSSQIVGAVSAGTVYSFDCDPAKALGPYFRAVLHTQSAAGDRLLAQVWETSKTV